MKSFYFDKYEDRRPYQPVKNNMLRTLIFQICGTLTIICGCIYLYWRWTQSINHDAPIFAYTLVIAESLSFVGMVLYIFDLWHPGDFEQTPAPCLLSEIEALEGRADRSLAVDVFIATLNEELELLRYTVRDAKKMIVPQGVRVKIYLLDDGRRDGRDPARENVKQMCLDEGIIYLTRESNAGYKAGNLKNGLDHSSGDIFVILDADSRPFPGFLMNTLGYFRQHRVGWVQTCHWFYDTTEAVPLNEYLIRSAGISSPLLKSVISKMIPPVKTGGDIFGSDPRQFYEVILRRRNYHNASFCCGAGSVHRREAVHAAAIKSFQQKFDRKINEALRQEKVLSVERRKEIHRKVLLEEKYTPFMFHASEDLYTSMVVHSDRERRWQSVLHPYVECKLLSPQDIETFVKQRRRYAEGSIDIAIRDNPLLKKGLSWRQKVCYFHTAWSYFSCIWVLIFLLSPIFYFFTHVLPVACTATEFFSYFLPFLLFNTIADKAGSWGVSQKRGKQYYICLFWLNLMSIVTVVSGKKIKFNVTSKQKQSNSNPIKHVWPHMLLITLTITGIIHESVLVCTGRQDLLLGFVLNSFWGMLNCYALNVIVRAAYWNIDPVKGTAEAGEDVVTGTDSMIAQTNN